MKKYNFLNVVYCPSSIFIQKFIDNNFTVGAQDLSPFEIGSYTGDISAMQLKSVGVKYVIIGHSERRKYYHEKEILLNKVKNAINNSIIPIYCIGETEDEYNNNLTLDVLKNEIEFIFSENLDLNNLIIAYEPIWAIGTGLIPSNDEIKRVIEYIKNYIYINYNINIKVLYGGSVNNKNIHKLEELNNVDGYLVGGCSVKVNDFIAMINVIK